MTEKRIKMWFYWPVTIIVSIILLPIKLIMLIGWVIYKPCWFIREIVRDWIYEYNLFLIRHCDEAKEIKKKIRI